MNTLVEGKEGDVFSYPLEHNLDFAVDRCIADGVKGEEGHQPIFSSGDD